MGGGDSPDSAQVRENKARDQTIAEVRKEEKTPTKENKFRVTTGSEFLSTDTEYILLTEYNTHPCYEYSVL